MFPLRITWILRSPFRKPPGLEVGKKGDSFNVILFASMVISDPTTMVTANPTCWGCGLPQMRVEQINIGI